MTTGGLTGGHITAYCELLNVPRVATLAGFASAMLGCGPRPCETGTRSLTLTLALPLALTLTPTRRHCLVCELGWRHTAVCASALGKGEAGTLARLA